MIRKTYLACLLVSAFVLSGCTSMRLNDFFQSYVQQMTQARIALQAGRIDQAYSLVPAQRQSHNAYNLSLLEQGRIAFLQHDWQKSQQLFSQAYEDIEQENEKAKIQLSLGVESATSLISNDSAIRYDVPSYEQSMMHSYQALNYLYQGSIESALVEVRRANLVQKNALQNNESDIYAALDEMSANGLSRDTFDQNFPSLEPTLADVKNGFQNAYTFYLSGLLYEAAGELSDAYIDYKKALEIFPENSYIQQDVFRLATVLNMVDEIAIFQQEFSDNSYYQPADNVGHVVIFYEQSLVQTKHEATINLPLHTRNNDMRFFNFSLPVYHENEPISEPLMLNVNGEEYQSESIVKLQSLATKALQQELPMIVARQLLRVVAKEKLRRKMKKEGGDFGNILAGLYNLASEHADTRSWLSLPRQIHLLKVSLPVGEHQLDIKHGGVETIINVAINKDRISLINLTTLGEYSDYSTINL